ncbi:MAG TPA: hypothetical protein V6C76_01850 [Drouetiella sp.]
MQRPIIGVSLIYAVTAVLMFACGFFSLGTFPLLSAGSLLLGALAVTGFAWFIYCVIGYAVCAPLKVEQPGFALPTLIGTVSGAASIALTAWLFPSLGIESGWFAALPFAFVNTLAVWGTAFATGYVRLSQTFWPTFRS